MRCAACIDQPGSFNPDLAADVPLPELDDKGQKAHGQFMTYVFDLIDGTRDSSQYEDDVRALLGARTLLFPFLSYLKTLLRCVNICDPVYLLGTATMRSWVHRLCTFP